MREVKFRYWHKESEVFLDSSEVVFCNGKVYRDYRNFEDGIESDVAIQQYTGLKDRNGVEIYCGDIIKDVIPDKIYLVLGSLMDCAIQGLYNDTPKRYKVIGNIYENGDLLK